jgi:hypothetical protein
LQRIIEVVDRLFHRFSSQTDNRRAAILGTMFGLLMCVIVLLIWVIFGFIASLGQ